MKAKINSKRQVVFSSLVWILLVLFILGASRTAPLKASMTTATHLVCPSGPPTCDYDSIQDAVDTAGSGDLIKVAEGTYTGVYERAAPAEYDGPDDIIQMVYLTKTVTIRGGYAAGDWATSDPAAHPTTLDAQGLGRVLFIAGDIAPVIEGLRLTGGDATEMGGTLWADAGGGVYIQTAAATIKKCDVYKNAAGSDWSGTGGGVFLGSSPAVVRDSTIHDNVASEMGEGYGGGMALDNSDASISNNFVFDNIASKGDWGYGGGIDLFASSAVLKANRIYGNTASTADQGYGGGLHIDQSAAELTNNSVIDNSASTAHDGRGGGLYISGTAPSLTHTTISRNLGGNGSGLYLAEKASLTLTNTIIAGQATGIYAEGDSTVQVNSVLWYGNTNNTAGGGTANVSNARTGSPAFAADGYHIQSGSAAIDAGIDAKIGEDIDGESRPNQIADLGADEYWPSEIPIPTPPSTPNPDTKYLYLPLITDQ